MEVLFGPPKVFQGWRADLSCDGSRALFPKSVAHDLRHEYGF
jgi:hypothetical protein